MALTAAWADPVTGIGADGFESFTKLAAADANEYILQNLMYLYSRPAAVASDFDNSVISTSSTSWVDVTGISVPVTTGAARLLILASGSLNCTNNFTYLTLDLDGTNLGNATYGMAAIGGGSGPNYGFSLAHITTTPVAAGAHTVKLRVRVAGGTANITLATLVVLEV